MTYFCHHIRFLWAAAYLHMLYIFFSFALYHLFLVPAFHFDGKPQKRKRRQKERETRIFWKKKKNPTVSSTTEKQVIWLHIVIFPVFSFCFSFWNIFLFFFFFITFFALNSCVSFCPFSISFWTWVGITFQSEMFPPQQTVYNRGIPLFYRTKFQHATAKRTCLTSNSQTEWAERESFIIKRTNNNNKEKEKKKKFVLCYCKV